MSSLLLLVVCLLLGLSIANFARPPRDLAQRLNWWVMNIALPATVLQLIPNLKFDSTLWFLAAGMWLVFAGGWSLARWLGTRNQWNRGTVGCLGLTAGLCNSSFVGFPLIEALRGKQALGYAVIADQFGSFLALSIGGSVLATLYSGGSTDVRTITRKVILFPPLIAVMIGALLGLTPGLPLSVQEMLGRLASTLTPLALFSVGLQLRLRLSPHHTAPLLIGLLWKLGLAPFIVYEIGRLLHINQQILAVTVLEAAMAPMVSSAIMAEQYDLDPQLGNMMVGLGVLLSFLTVPLWNLIL